MTKNKNKCSVCGEIKSGRSIVKSSKGASVCKQCKSHANRWTRYGLTPWAYEKLLTEQKNKCAICEIKFFGKKNIKVAVDHCHDTKMIRGLICIDCNTGLGQFGDSKEVVENAWRYLDRENFIKPDWQGEVYTLLRFYFRGDKIENKEGKEERLSISEMG